MILLCSTATYCRYSTATYCRCSTATYCRCSTATYCRCITETYCSSNIATSLDCDNSTSPVRSWDVLVICYVLGIRMCCVGLCFVKNFKAWMLPPSPFFGKKFKWSCTYIDNILDMMLIFEVHQIHHKNKKSVPFA